MLPHVEESKMIKMVGWENYQSMLDDKKDFSSVQKWNDETTYLEGDEVIYKGIVYVADENITNNNTPNDCSQWSEAEIFDDECYNKIWYEGGLRKIIAWYVFAEAAPSYPQILDVAGFSDSDDDKMVNKIQFYLNNIYKQIQMMKDTFIRWHSKNGSCMSISLCGNTVNDDSNRTERKDNL